MTDWQDILDARGYREIAVLEYNERSAQIIEANERTSHPDPQPASIQPQKEEKL
jgi:hypothetical protein